MYKRFIKRVLDLFFALCLVPFFLFVFLIVGSLILLLEGRPVLYSSPRRGKDGKIFTMHKFRSMVNDAPDLRHGDGSTFNAPDDERLTKIGKFIRKTSLDELPQVVNILKGEMSFIGPRPTMTDVPVSEYGPHRLKKITVRPGITGYTQAYYRNSVGQEEKFQLDAFYVDKMSFIFDLKILIKTFGTVFLRKNIYETARPKDRANIQGDL